MDYDLKVVGAEIVDGSGRERYRGDVAIKDRRIVALGAAPGQAHSTVDAGGLVVAPGFVDIHTHYDAQVMWDRMLSISPWHGVTTAVLGNCGFGVAPTRPVHRELIVRTLEKVEGMSVDALEAGLGANWPFETFPEFLAAIEQRGIAINIGALVGHTPVRLWVMGEAAMERTATDAEIAANIRRVQERFGYVVDPHTACAFQALNQERFSIVLSTAHPAKFPEAMRGAIDHEPTHPALEELTTRPVVKQITLAPPATWPVALTGS